MIPYRCKLNGVMFENPTEDIILANGYTKDDATRISGKIQNHYNGMIPSEVVWRDEEIKRTDFIFYPDVTTFNDNQIELMKIYRQALRQYPRQCEIPYTRPTKPNFFK